ncbi:MAG: DUF892 family protein [Balneolia bacterium]|nr:DUF892 family protein [Balneolia bacterium]
MRNESTDNSAIFTGLNEQPQISGVYPTQLEELFAEELMDILWVEKALHTSLPVLVAMANSEELKKTLSAHLKQTSHHIKSLNMVFATINKKPVALISVAMADLILETLEMVDFSKKGPNCDIGIILAVQKMRYNKISSYEKLRGFSHSLQIPSAVKLFDQNLSDEKSGNQKLIKVVLKIITEDGALKRGNGQTASHETSRQRVNFNSNTTHSLRSVGR